jgi:hypothetical protein
MPDDDDRTPVATPRARRHSSVATDAAKHIADDLHRWAEHAAGVRLPPLPRAVLDRVAQRIAAGARAGSALEQAECERLRDDLTIVTRERDRLRVLLDSTQRELDRTRNAMRGAE